MRSQAIFKSSAGQCKICRWGNRLRTHLRRRDYLHGVCGWNDGGCTLLAHALKRHLGPEASLATVASPTFPEGGDHTFVRFRGHNIDADGAHQSDGHMASKIRQGSWTDSHGFTLADHRETRAHMHHDPMDCRRLALRIDANVGRP